MQNPNTDPTTMLPLLLTDDNEIDMKTLFLITTLMQANRNPTNDQLNSLLPFLLLDDDSTDSNMEIMLLMQTMSEGEYWTKLANFDHFFFSIFSISVFLT